MSTIVISQPTYLPWSGYFDLIDRASIFVFLDDVQFERRSWQQRNRIISKDEYLTISVPVQKKGKRGQLIKDVKIANYNFKNKHMSSIMNCYSKYKFFPNYFEEIKSVFDKSENTQYLVDLNINLIKWLCNKIGIKTIFMKSSELDVSGKKSEKLINICLKLNKINYLTSFGSIEYIKKDKDVFDDAGIKISFQNYKQAPYNQKSNFFLENPSILDLLFKEGPDSLSIIRKGRKKDIVIG